MDKELQIPRIKKLATTGVGHFGEGAEVGVRDPLFRVVAGHPLDHAVEQATVLMCAVHKISDLAMVETDHLPTLLTAVHYLSGMAKALAQDVNHGLMVGRGLSRGGYLAGAWLPGRALSRCKPAPTSPDRLAFAFRLAAMAPGSTRYSGPWWRNR